MEFALLPLQNSPELWGKQGFKGQSQSRMTVYFPGRILNLSPESIRPQVLAANG
jgi:hypothetical protein